MPRIRQHSWSIASKFGSVAGVERRSRRARRMFAIIRRASRRIAMAAQADAATSSRGSLKVADRSVGLDGCGSAVRSIPRRTVGNHRVTTVSHRDGWNC